MIKYDSCQRAQIAEVSRHIYRKVDETIGRRLYRQRNSEHCIATDSALRNEGGTCIVATDKSKIAGYITVSTRVRAGRIHGEILQLHVFLHWRRQGVGSQLVHLAMQWMLDQKVLTASVLVSPNNEDALSLYRKAGLVPATLELERPLGHQAAA